MTNDNDNKCPAPACDGIRTLVLSMSSSIRSPFQSIKYPYYTMTCSKCGCYRGIQDVSNTEIITTMVEYNSKLWRHYAGTV